MTHLCSQDFRSRELPVAKLSHDHLAGKRKVQLRLGYSAMIRNLGDLIHNKRLLSSPLEFFDWQRKIVFLMSGTNVPPATPNKEEF